MKQTMTLAGILLAFTLCLTSCGDHNAKSNVNVPTEYCEELVKLAKNGNVVAQYNLALCYDQGEGVAQSKTEAANWYRMAAEQGLAQAQFNLGYCYAHGLGVVPLPSTSRVYHNMHKLQLQVYIEILQQVFLQDEV